MAPNRNIFERESVYFYNLSNMEDYEESIFLFRFALVVHPGSLS